MANFIENQHNMPSADYVIDFGENWEKWNSGKLVQRGYDTMQGYNEGNAKNIVYPIPFANNQAQVITQLVRNADTFGVSPSIVVNRTDSTSTYFRAYHTSSNAIAVFINWEAVGRWK